MAKTFENEWRCDLGKRDRPFKKKVMLKSGVYISDTQAYRAKNKALRSTKGDSAEQYGKLWDYDQSLLESNPRSTIIPWTEGRSDGTTFFNKLYICLNACKRCFRSEGSLGGVLLTADDMDLKKDPYILS